VNTLIILFITFFLQLSQASIGTIDISDLSDEPSTSYFGQLGFKINAQSTEWYQVSSEKLKSKTVQAEYRSLDDSNPGRLTVRSESLNKSLSLAEYIRRSAKDYRRFGFKILDLRPLTINQNKAFVLDLDKEDSELQTRQILFKKNNKVIILTCTGHKIKFQTDLKSCNQIARNFEWTKSSDENIN
jgi:hypothetical protein